MCETGTYYLPKYGAGTWECFLTGGADKQKRKRIKKESPLPSGHATHQLTSKKKEKVLTSKLLPFQHSLHYCFWVYQIFNRMLLKC